MADTERELEQLKKRFTELAGKCYEHSVYCFTGFLGLAELDAFYQVKRTFPHVPCALFGGDEACERKMVRFGDEEMLGYVEDFPIACVAIRPVQEKFAEELTHRDFLGACMNLGLERDRLGDIVLEGKCAWVYCMRTVAPFIAENLTKVRHTTVTCSLCQGEVHAPSPRLQEREYQVSSPRLDAVVAKACNLSREKSLSLFREKRIFVNGRQQESGNGQAQEGDVISVRGVGRFVYRGVLRQTRKGKWSVRVDFYV